MYCSSDQTCCLQVSSQCHKYHIFYLHKLQPQLFCYVQLLSLLLSLHSYTDIAEFCILSLYQTSLLFVLTLKTKCKFSYGAVYQIVTNKNAYSRTTYSLIPIEKMCIFVVSTKPLNRFLIGLKLTEIKIG